MDSSEQSPRQPESQRRPIPSRVTLPGQGLHPQLRQAEPGSPAGPIGSASTSTSSWWSRCSSSWSRWRWQTRSTSGSAGCSVPRRYRLSGWCSSLPSSACCWAWSSVRCSAGAREGRASRVLPHSGTLNGVRGDWRSAARRLATPQVDVSNAMLSRTSRTRLSLSLPRKGLRGLSRPGLGEHEPEGGVGFQAVRRSPPWMTASAAAYPLLPPTTGD